MKTNMTEGQKKFYMNKAMATYGREIENTSQRIDGLKVIAADAIGKKDISTLEKVNKIIKSLVAEQKTMYEELEVIRSEYIREYGAI